MTKRHARIGVRLIYAAAVACLWSGRVGAQSPPSPDIARGRHIATALAGCADCHGTTFAGGRAFARPGLTVHSSNLTSGAGGITAYDDADLRRAIRGAVRPDGQPLAVMPSREYAVMTDRDVDDLIAFLRTLPPVDNVVPHASASPGTAAPAPSPTPAGAAHASVLTGGAYLATISGCTNCHGANLVGGVRPGGAIAPNISRDGIGAWTFTDFQTAMRTGRTPSGHLLSNVMPWETFAKMSDEELRLVYDFLESQPARAN